MNLIKWHGKSKAQMHRFITSNEKDGYVVSSKKKHQKTYYIEMTKIDGGNEK
ncbi:hypothetical protein [Carnobacterium maltaromaticum]|uniref:hypothetical protein n=1 Tax=Carnobacterium maltaromaticum TaxID=2751 RepID=UPI0012F783F1|nr:hypothetical protein [Carnobacterium maltaromaticum]